MKDNVKPMLSTLTEATDNSTTESGQTNNLPEQSEIQNTEHARTCGCIIDQLETVCSVQEINAKIENIKPTVYDTPISTDLTIGDLTQSIKRAIKITGTFSNKSLEIRTLIVIPIGVLANDQKDLIVDEKQEKWTEFAIQKYGDILSHRTLQQYMRVAGFSDSMEYAYLGITSLDRLIAAILKKDKSANLIRPFLIENNIDTEFNRDSFTETENKKREIRVLLEKLKATPPKSDSIKIKPLSNSIVAFNKYSNADIANRTLQIELFELLGEAQKMVEKIRIAIAPETENETITEEQLDLPLEG